MTDQLLICFILVGTLILFVWGHWRYDLVALIALLSSVLLGVVPPMDAFSGFSEPAVIIVALVLIVGKGITNSGIVDALSRPLTKLGNRPFLQLSGFLILITITSGFMNNIAALAIIMPIAMTACRKGKTSPSLVLMPLAFCSLLGGMTTMIGTPPNIILSTYRQKISGKAFSLFDFTPVGAGVALAGVAFILILGWRFIPIRKRQASPEKMYEIEGYVAQILIPVRSKMAGKTIEEFENATEGEIVIRNVIRNGKPLSSTSGHQKLKGLDKVVIEADSETIQALILRIGAELIPMDNKSNLKETIGEDMMMLEAVVPHTAPSLGKAPNRLRLRHLFDVNLIAVARHGSRIKGHISNIRLQQGDVLLMKGASKDLAEAVAALGCFPLADRGIRMENSRYLMGAIPLILGVLAASMKLMPIHISFLSVALIMIATKLVSLREAYDSIDWSIIVLLGALIPLGQAFETSGAAESVSHTILYLKKYDSPILMLAVVLISTMFLSDIINNVASAILMAPIAVGIALDLGVSIDPFLMSVAIGASCAFLTPIGHQSNTMVMGAGGYKFTDYWRLGLPLEIVITAVSIPLIQFFWPF